jgi:hypothetical protein
VDWKSIGKQLAAIGLPILGTALGGPAGGLVGKAIAGALGLGQDATPEQTAAALGNLSGEQLVALRAIEADLAKEQLKSDTALALGQIEVNKIDAASDSMFQKGWRPMAGWAAVAMALIYPPVRVILPWALKVSGVDGVPELPPLDAVEALGVLGALLGVGSMRHKERLAGKA